MGLGAEWGHSVADGDRDAFWGVWDEHARAVRRVCARFFAGRRDQAEDAFGTAMLRAWDQLPDRVGAIHDVDAWLRVLARNVCLELHRREKREVLIGSDVSRVPDAQRAAPPDSDLRELLERVDRLPEPLRDVLRDRAVSGLSIRDIAEARCLTPSVVRERLTAARKALHLSCRQARDPESPGPKPVTICTRLSALGRAARQTRPIQVPTPSGGTSLIYVVVDGVSARRSVRIETLRRVVEAHPRSWRRRLELAHLLFAHGDLADAAEQYALVSARNPLALDAHLRRSEALRLLGRADEAATCAEHAAGLFRSVPTRDHLMAMAALARGRVDECVALLQEAAEMAPEDPRHISALALVFHGQGRFVEAAAAFDRILEKDPDDILALVKSHDALLSTGRYEENYARMDRALKLDPDNVQVLRMVGGRPQSDREGVRRTYRRSMALLRRAVRLAPDCSDVWDAIARLYERYGKPEQGVAVLQTLVREYPNHSDAWSDLAEALGRAGRWAEAAGAVRTAIALAPGSALVLGRAVLVFGRAGRIAEMRSAIDALTASAPGHWGTWCVVARAHLEFLGDPVGALRYVRRAVGLAPELSSARLTHAEIALGAGEHREALRAAGAAYRLLPPDRAPQGAAVARVLARAYAALGLVSRARKWYECCADLARQVVRWYPIPARITLAEALEGCGRRTEALAVCCEALGLWPEQDAREELDAMAARLRVA